MVSGYSSFFYIFAFHIFFRPEMEPVPLNTMFDIFIQFHRSPMIPGIWLVGLALAHLTIQVLSKGLQKILAISLSEFKWWLSSQSSPQIYHDLRSRTYHGSMRDLNLIVLTCCGPLSKPLWCYDWITSTCATRELIWCLIDCLDLLLSMK